jgi:hypothetical protein
MRQSSNPLLLYSIAGDVVVHILDCGLKDRCTALCWFRLRESSPDEKPAEEHGEWTWNWTK